MLRPASLLAGAASLAALALASGALSQGGAPPPAPPPGGGVRPAVEGNRGAYEVAFTPDGATALVTEQDEGALAVIDRRSGTVRAHIPTGGTEPTGVAVTPDGKVALVTNSFSGSLAFIDLATRKVETLPMPGAPWDVMVLPDGTTAFVSVSQLDEVAVVDLATRKEVARIPTGRRPRALDMTRDGRTLVAANLTQGSVTFIDTANRRAFASGPTTAVNLRGVAVFPNGRRVYVVGQRAQNERPTETAIGIWSNQAFVQVPNGRPNTVDNIWLDLLSDEVSDPDSVVLDQGLTRAYMTCTGGHSVLVSGLRSEENVTIREVGACPKGLTFTPDQRELWVANNLSNDVAVIDPATLKVVRRISLGPTSRKDPHLRGRFLFHTAGITDGKQFSCASCHPDGGTDGITWKFVHVKDAFGREADRNARSLRGEIGDTAPFRWTGHDRTLDQFVDEELAGLLHSPPVSREDRQALVRYISTLPLNPNPYRQTDGSLTEAGQRGKALFAGKAGCVECHTGPKAGGQRMAWIGTTPKEIPLDVPHLNGVFDSYPYLHHGKAQTLEEIFTRFNEQKLHGKVDTLTPAELADLLAYVRQM